MLGETVKQSICLFFALRENITLEYIYAYRSHMTKIRELEHMSYQVGNVREKIICKQLLSYGNIMRKILKGLKAQGYAILL